MASGNITIDPDVAEVLGSGSGTDDLYRLPAGQLDRKLYLRVSKVLEALGGKWNRRRSLFIGPAGYADKIAAALAVGKAVDQDKADAWFATPPAVAAKVVELLGEIPAGSRILEPSAGDGALLVALALSGKAPVVQRGDLAPCFVMALELAAARAEAACAAAPWAAGRIYLEDFLVMPVDVYGGKFDRILMNPPWGHGREYAHVLHALELLAPGGRLVAVLPAGVRWRENKAADDFRRAADLAGPHRFHDLPSGSFHSCGTDVETCILTLDKAKEA